MQNRKKMCVKLIKKNKKIELKIMKKINSNASVALIKYLKKNDNKIFFFIIGVG